MLFQKSKFVDIEKFRSFTATTSKKVMLSSARVVGSHVKTLAKCIRLSMLLTFKAASPITSMFIKLIKIANRSSP
jgi:hypothetical protein